MRTFRSLRCLAIVATLQLTAPAFADFSLQGFGVLPTNLNSRSASLADIDNDNDLDLMFQGGSGAQKLFRNNLESGSLSFTQIADMTNVGVTAGSWSAAWGDINNDGLVDAFIGQSNIGQSGDVLVNQGGGVFANESVQRGLNDPGFHQNVAWADMDGNGKLDLVIAMEGPEPHEIYLQHSRGGAFSSIATEAGFQNLPAEKAYGMAIGDTDGDGDLDVYISTCRNDNNIRNFFYENQLAQTGEVSFVEIADTNGTQNFRNSYGAEFHDFDDDGDLDLFVVGADRQASKLYRNDGGNQFTDTDTLRNSPLLTDVGGDLNGGRAVDYDNDGDLDLFFHDQKPQGGANSARKLYRNDGNWQFTDVTAAENLFDLNRGSYDSPWGDLDRDGDQDLIATTDSGSFEQVYLSDEAENGNNWLYVELDGPDFNRTGLGSTLYATINEGTPEERTLRREANTNAGTFNQSDLPVHFGLGDADLIDELKIVWTDGTEEVYQDVAANQYLPLVFGDAPVPGDFDGDGRVDNFDLGFLLANWGESTVPPEWINGFEAPVDNGELNALLSNWGFGTGTAAVPEPAAAMMLLPLLAARRRRRR